MNKVKQLTIAARYARDIARTTLLKAAQLDPQTYDQRVWAIRETREEKPSGKVTTELRLYKLQEAVVFDTFPDGDIDVRTGIVHLRDFPTDPTHPHYYDPTKGEER